MYLSQAIISKIDALIIYQDIRVSRLRREKLKIMAAWFTQQHLQRANKTSYINTPCTRLIRLVGERAYRWCLDALIDLRVLFQNSSYSTGGEFSPKGAFSKSYKIGGEFLGDLVPIKIAAPPLDLSLNPFLAEVGFTDKGAEYVLARIAKFKNPKRTASWRYAFDSISNRSFWIKKDPKTGRIFSNVTNLPAELRAYLTLRGEPTAELDIANSQPFFASTLYPNPTTERETYLATVRSGLFYEAINGGLRKPIEKRSVLKRKIFREIFFGRSDATNEAWAVFAQQFPELAACITELKKDGHNRFALLLQTAEAGTVINGLLAYCISADIPCLTVHDSVICRKQDVGTIKGLLEAFAKAATGAVPEIRYSA